MKSVTISDVAKAAGVSVTTVSRFINNNYDKMSKDTKTKIEMTINKLNYRPSASARRMRTNKSKMIGLIVGDISNVFSSLLFSGIYQILQPLGYSVLLLNTNNSVDEENKGINRLLEHQVDGLIIQPSQNDFKNYHFILDAGVPLVTVDRYVKNQPKSIGKVTTDNFEASQKMAIELVKYGYRKVILISRLTVNTSAQIPRIKGFSSSFQHTINIDVYNHSDEWMKNEIVKHIDYQNEKTALVSLMGPLLFKILGVINSLNLHFPDQIGLTSFDDWNWAQYVNGGIDLIQQNPLEMGESAAEILIKTMEEKTSQNIEPTIIQAKRVQGNSLCKSN
ncbi:LacI family DNA-binding transcriptional regulator [Lentilactobacillus hilgardii]|uniref:LacI family DNA-binding transcriptional regulator n=1 Tax=Lentilactobacillus hilgardii TaxID=1588 RepID=UPI00390C8357